VCVYNRILITNDDPYLCMPIHPCSRCWLYLGCMLIDWNNGIKLFYLRSTGEGVCQCPFTVYRYFGSQHDPLIKSDRLRFPWRMKSR
jgi:hypothetical protein